MTDEQLKTEINHILDSGANDIRLIELFEKYSFEYTCDLALKFAKWKDENSVNVDFQHEINHTNEQYFDYFLRESKII
jgi:hypothetical protein